MTIYPIKIGLTGGIGSGKSTVAKLLRAYDYPIYDSDIKAKLLMETDEYIIEKITKTFGKESYILGKLNRQFISDNVFSSQTKLAKINEIVHSAVIDDFKLWVEQQTSKVVFFESAIIFENQLECNFDKTIAVVSPNALRIKRVKQRSSLSVKEIKKRIQKQMPQKDIITKADFLLVNNEKQPLIPQIDYLIKQIKL